MPVRCFRHIIGSAPWGVPLISKPSIGRGGWRGRSISVGQRSGNDELTGSREEEPSAKNNESEALVSLSWSLHVCERMSRDHYLGFMRAMMMLEGRVVWRKRPALYSPSFLGESDWTSSHHCSSDRTVRASPTRSLGPPCRQSGGHARVYFSIISLARGPG
jgi:hypothetical protein